MRDCGREPGTRRNGAAGRGTAALSAGRLWHDRPRVTTIQTGKASPKPKRVCAPQDARPAGLPHAHAPRWQAAVNLHCGCMAAAGPHVCLCDRAGRVNVLRRSDGAQLHEWKIYPKANKGWAQLRCHSAASGSITYDMRGGRICR